MVDVHSIRWLTGVMGKFGSVHLVNDVHNIRLTTLCYEHVQSIEWLMFITEMVDRSSGEI